MTRERSSRNRQRHEASESVTVTSKIAGKVVGTKESNKRIPIDNLQDIPHVARIKVGCGVTKNMSEMQFVRVDIAVEWPCVPTEKEADKTYAFLSKYVEDLVQEELELASEKEVFDVR